MNVPCVILLSMIKISSTNRKRKTALNGNLYHEQLLRPTSKEKYLLRWTSRKISSKVRTTNVALGLLAILVFVVIWKIFQALQLDNPTWSLCVTLKTRESPFNTSTCNRLSWKEAPGVFENLPVGGKYMQRMERPRDFANFLIQPTVDDIVSVVSECGDAGHVKWTLVNLIKSSASNSNRRHVIRQTWGSVEVYLGLRIKNVFIVGTTSDPKVQQRLEAEGQTYNDILQLDVEDSAKAVPDKVLAGMQWAAMSLLPSTLYSSMDDDVVIHVPNLARYLRRVFLQPPSCSPTARPQYPPCLTDLPLMCVYSYQSNDSPSRLWYSKWFISYQEFPGKKWPKYCRGGMYIAPARMVRQLFHVSLYTPLLYLDDVWVTGFMRRRLGMGDLNIVPAPHSVRHDLEFKSTSDSFSDILIQHLWGNMKDGADISGLISRTWQEWKIDLSPDITCLSNNFNARSRSRRHNTG